MRHRIGFVLPLVLGGGLLLACSEPSPSGPALPTHVSAARSPALSAATFRLPRPGSIVSMRGDGLFPDGSDTKYTDRVCGVMARVFAPNPTQDAVVQTANPSAEDRKCVAYS